MALTMDLAKACLDEVNKFRDDGDNLLGGVFRGLFPSAVLQLRYDLGEELRVAE